MSDPFQLERFVTAQQPVHDQVMAELAAGQKRTHWMWFVFPQLAGLGSSPMARTYAISGIAEARAYLTHPVLAPRLTQCCQQLMAIDGRSVREIFGSPDDMKLHSSLTLFSQVSGAPAVLTHCLDKYFGGRLDQASVLRD